jgi:hypothetical protein
MTTPEYNGINTTPGVNYNGNDIGINTVNKTGTGTVRIPSTGTIEYDNVNNRTDSRGPPLYNTGIAHGYADAGTINCNRFGIGTYNGDIKGTNSTVNSTGSREAPLYTTDTNGYANVGTTLLLTHLFIDELTYPRQDFGLRAEPDINLFINN